MITLPLAFAALTAGAIGGVHCVGMCGGISALLSRNANTPRKVIIIANSDIPGTACQPQRSDGHLRYQLLLHSGRLLTYALIGALFGGLGATGLLLSPYLPIQKILFVIGNVALVFLGLRLFGLRVAISLFKGLAEALSRFTSTVFPTMHKSVQYPFFIGMSWGCLPCGLLFGMAPFAVLSGDAISGAGLMLLFGLAALPHLLLAQRLAKYDVHGRFSSGVRLISASLLILTGLLGLWYFDMKDMPSFLCVTAVA